MIITDPRAFVRRIANIYGGHRRRAREFGQELDYNVESLRALVSTATSCDYCGVCLTGTNFTLDHMVPTSRNGRHAIANLVVCCVRCNEVKGRLTHTEFHALIDALGRLAPVVYHDVSSRLRAGGKALGLKFAARP